MGLGNDRVWRGFASVGTPIPSDLPDLEFCAEWNPEFSFNGNRCCRSLESTHTKKARVGCFSRRPRGSYCDEMSDEERDYTDAVKAGRVADILRDIDSSKGIRQSYCTVNNGFLAHGRRIIPSDLNRIVLRSPERCTEFGTDPMVGMIEWLGRQVAQKYSTPEMQGTHLLIGDVSAPRGGCLAGPSGVHGHLSHTAGKDADIGLLTPKKDGRSPTFFHNDVNAEANWWMAKQIFKNPYACVKVIFFDRRNIRKLAKYAARDPDWRLYGRFFRHQAGHRNHMHVRVGDYPGPPGCGNAHPELESGDEGDSDVGDPSVESSSDLISNLQSAPEHR
jgi:murein endopeptidase